MTRSLALGGALLLLCACTLPVETPAAQPQRAPTSAVGSDPDSAVTPERLPVENPEIAARSADLPQVRASDRTESGELRTSYATCVARSGGVTPAIQDCMAAEADYQSGRLAFAMKQLRASLQGPERRALELEQADWEMKGATACQWDAEEEGQGQRLEANECSLQRTAARAAELSNRNAAR